MKVRVISLLCVEVLAAGSASIRVIGHTEGWFADGRELARGDAIPAAAKITGHKPGDLILDCGAAGWLAYACDKPPCRVRPCQSIEGGTVRRVDPDARGEGTVQPALKEMLAAYLRREPAFPVTPGAHPDDAVVGLIEDEVDWAPALDGLPAGRCCFRVSWLPASATDKGIPFTLDWDRARQGSARVRIAGLQPGTNALRMGVPASQDRCIFDDTAAAAWIAIVPEGSWTKKNQAWKSYAPWFRELERSGVSPSVVATVRRAVLAWLIDTAEMR